MTARSLLPAIILDLRELLHPARASVRIGYSLAHGKLAPGETSKRHRLASSEVYYFLEAEVLLHRSAESYLSNRGRWSCAARAPCNGWTIPGPKRWHFLCLVEPAWKQEDEEVLE